MNKGFKQARNFLSIVSVVGLAYFSFPDVNNILVFLLKFAFYLMIITCMSFFIFKFWDFIFEGIAKNRKDWLRNSYESKGNLKGNLLKTNILKLFLYKLIKLLFIERRRTLFKIWNNKLYYLGITFVVCVFIYIFILLYI